MKTVLACVALLAISSMAKAGSLEVQVGYADNVRSSPFFPMPWLGDSGAGVITSAAGVGPSIDAGAIRIINNDAVSHTISGMTVNGFGDGSSYSLWSTVTIAPGLSAIFTQTGSDNTQFDTSDHQGGGPSTAIPVVTFSVDGGTPTALSDTAQVLNTEGTDHLAQAGLNESHQWRDIGTFGGQAAPEPSTFALLGLGIAGMAGYHLRKRKKS